MLSTLTECLFEIICMTALGYCARKTGILSEESSNGLSKLLINILLPCSILASSASSFDPGTGRNITLCILIGFIYYLSGIGLSYMLFRLIPIDDDKRGVATTSTIFGNTAFIGYPLVQQLWNDTGLQLALGFEIFFNPFMYTIGIRLFSAGSRGGKTLLKQIFSPCLISVIVANILYFSGIRFPMPLENVFSTVGKCTTPLSMIIIGAGFVNADIKSIFKDKYAYLVSFMKLLAFPMILYAALSLFKVPAEVKIICVTMSSLPVGSFNVILPRQYGGNVEFATHGLLISMIASVITIPLVIMAITHGITF